MLFSIHVVPSNSEFFVSVFCNFMYISWLHWPNYSCNVVIIVHVISYAGPGAVSSNVPIICCHLVLFLKENWTSKHCATLLYILAGFCIYASSCCEIVNYPILFFNYRFSCNELLHVFVFDEYSSVNVPLPP